MFKIYRVINKTMRDSLTLDEPDLYDKYHDIDLSDEQLRDIVNINIEKSKEVILEKIIEFNELNKNMRENKEYLKILQNLNKNN